MRVSDDLGNIDTCIILTSFASMPHLVSEPSILLHTAYYDGHWKVVERPLNYSRMKSKIIREILLCIWLLMVGTGHLNVEEMLLKPESISPIFMRKFLVIWSGAITRLEVG